jgi:hypothetical protein
MPAPRKATAKNATRKNATPRRAAPAKARKTFYATLHVTRVEEWCVEAENAAAARALLAGGEGERRRIGDCVFREIEDLSE